MKARTQRLDLHATRCRVTQYDDQALVERLHTLVADDCQAEAELLATMAEVDHRKLYRERAFPSMFQFAVDELHLSEGMAYKRITAARAARAYPILFDKVALGELHLSAICLLAAYLTPENHKELAARATHLSKRAIEKLIAEMFPKPDVAPRVRRLPSPGPSSPRLGQPRPKDQTSELDVAILAPSSRTSGTNTPREAPATSISQPIPQPGRVEPRSMERYKITFTAGQELVDQLEKAQQLLGPRQNSRDLAAVFSRALDVLVRDLENKKHGVTSRPRSSDRGDESEPTKGKRPRAIPRRIRREVYERDQGQCAYRDPHGRRCPERAGLEYHHRVPFAQGGEHSVANIELRCACHNALAAEAEFGAAFMARRIGQQAREARVRYQVAVGDRGRGQSQARLAEAHPTQAAASVYVARVSSRRRGDQPVRIPATGD